MLSCPPVAGRTQSSMVCAPPSPAIGPPRTSSFAPSKRSALFDGGSGVAVGVLVGGTGVAVGVLVGGTGVAVGPAVADGGTGVAVGVLVGGTGVVVGVLVGGTAVGVAVGDGGAIGAVDATHVGSALSAFAVVPSVRL